jgi:hypothetical protein
MPPTMNVFARTEADLYGSTIKPQKQEKSFDQLASELFKAKLSIESAELWSRLQTLRLEIVEFLAADDTAKVLELEQKHEAAILAVREAKKKLAAAGHQVFEGRKEHMRLVSLRRVRGSPAKVPSFLSTNLDDVRPRCVLGRFWIRPRRH